MPKAKTDSALLKGVDFSYGSEAGPVDGGKAVDGLSLRIRQGEFIAIIGRNGSGKSTLARLLNALLLPTAGSAVVNGIDTRDNELHWEIRSSCGMVFQDPDNQIVGSTVEEDVAFGPENLGLEPHVIQSRVLRSLETVALTEQAESPAHLLSGGEKQRVALAGILAMEPSCIILDEATSMLDPITRDSVMELLETLNRDKGITIVVITNRMEEAMRADRIVVLDKGNVAVDGNPEEIFADDGLIRRLGLDLPPVTELVKTLRGYGFDLPAGITDPDRAIEALVALHHAGDMNAHCH